MLGDRIKVKISQNQREPRVLANDYVGEILLGHPGLFVEGALHLYALEAWMLPLGHYYPLQIEHLQIFQGLQVL
jgi:hypothetical protein